MPGESVGDVAMPERVLLSVEWPHFASKCRCCVNQKRRENFEVKTICLPRRLRIDDLPVDTNPQLARS